MGYNPCSGVEKIASPSKLLTDQVYDWLDQSSIGIIVRLSGESNCLCSILINLLDRVVV
jgi:hypothetical protein